MNLNERLNHIETYPLHMPGHKRNPSFGIAGCEIDITEIDGFDNLHNPTGMIQEVQDKFSQLYSSRCSYLLVNGSTCGILAAIFSITSPGDTIIAARNCHKSVYNACFLNRLKIIYIEPDFDPEYGIYTRITQGAVDKALSEHPEAKGVVIVSPTYEGFISRINCQIPLIVDCAHGAHFGFYKMPEKIHGDITVCSLHKTLPSLTQTAVLNVYNQNLDEKIKRYLAVFQSTSPSYVLMNAAAKCADFLWDKKSHAYFKELLNFKQQMESTKIVPFRFIPNDDPCKIVIFTGCTRPAVSGPRLAQQLRERGFEAEMAAGQYIVLMITVGDRRDQIERLLFHLKDIANQTQGAASCAGVGPPPLPEKALDSFSVQETSRTDLTQAAGKICGEAVYAYPPDIPLLLPGEIISEEIIEYICDESDRDVNICSDSNLLPQEILTKA